jgi:hypothetical protein
MEAIPESTADGTSVMSSIFYGVFCNHRRLTIHLKRLDCSDFTNLSFITAITIIFTAANT